MPTPSGIYGRESKAEFTGEPGEVVRHGCSGLGVEPMRAVLRVITWVAVGAALLVGVVSAVLVRSAFNRLREIRAKRYSGRHGEEQVR